MTKTSLLGTLAALAVVMLFLFTSSCELGPDAEAKQAIELDAMMTQLLPGSSSFTPEEYSGEDGSISRVFKADTGYVIETVTAGYVDDITLLVGVSNEGTVTGVVVRDMEETFGLGKKALTDTEFLSQFLHTSGDAVIGENVDAMTGATVSSKAIARGVNAAAGFVTGADAVTSATEWGG